MIHSSRCTDRDRPLKLATANGEITADQRIHENVGTIGTTLDPLELDKTVDAISVGRLVLEKNFSFHWPSGGNANLIDMHGNRTECETKGFAPVLKHIRPTTTSTPSRAPFPPSTRWSRRILLSKTVRPKNISPRTRSSRQRPTPPSTCCFTAPRTPSAGSVVYRRWPRSRLAGWALTIIVFSLKHSEIMSASITPSSINTEKSRGLNGEHAAVFVMDIFTRFTDLVPVADKTSEEALRAIRYFLGEHKTGRLYSDNSKELEVAAKELGMMRQTAAPHRPQTNAFAERGIRTMLEGTRAVASGRAASVILAHCWTSPRFRHCGCRRTGRRDIPVDELAWE